VIALTGDYPGARAADMHIERSAGGVKDNDPARLYIGGNNFNGEAINGR
jgi:hypothetical protein